LHVLRHWQKKILEEERAKCDLKSEGDSEEMQLKRIVADNEGVNVRVKSLRDEKLVEEWAQVRMEIDMMRKAKEIDNEKRLEEAKQQVLVEMVGLSVNFEELFWYTYETEWMGSCGTHFWFWFNLGTTENMHKLRRLG
jgi:hypothetical protein